MSLPWACCIVLALVHLVLSTRRVDSHIREANLTRCAVYIAASFIITAVSP